MYKYSKAVKERIFKDNYMAFLWMYFRFYSEPDQVIKEEKEGETDLHIKESILKELDALAMKRLKKGHYSFCCFIVSLSISNRSEIASDSTKSVSTN